MMDYVPPHIYGSVVLGKKYRQDTLSNESSLRYPHMSHATVLWYSQHARDNFPSGSWSYFAQQLGHTLSLIYGQVLFIYLVD